jgi:FAD synthase
MHQRLLQKLEKLKVVDHKLPITFTATTIKGSGRGKLVTVPTINVNLKDVPFLKNGVYAAYIQWNGATYQAAMHMGNRPTFNDDKSCELHILDSNITKTPNKVTVIVINFIRTIKTFNNASTLKETIMDDIKKIRGILDKHEITKNS